VRKPRVGYKPGGFRVFVTYKGNRYEFTNMHPETLVAELMEAIDKKIGDRDQGSQVLTFDDEELDPGEIPPDQGAARRRFSCSDRIHIRHDTGGPRYPQSKHSIPVE
jgi:hypothetical protein